MFPGDMSCPQGIHEVSRQGDMILNLNLKGLDTQYIKTTKIICLRQRLPSMLLFTQAIYQKILMMLFVTQNERKLWKKKSLLLKK